MTGYNEIVTKPMDFGTVLSNIDTGLYINCASDATLPAKTGDTEDALPQPCKLFLADCKLVWENCIAYWSKHDPAHYIIEDAKFLKEQFMDSWESMVLKKLNNYRISQSFVYLSANTYRSSSP